MPQVVFVPGVFGCRMNRQADGFELWPPVGQTISISVQERVDGLLDPTTRPGGIIQWINDPLLRQPEYGPVLRAISGMPGVTLRPFPYDWRKDLTVDLPNALAAFLDGLPTGQRIILVAHSMGGLIVRWLLESGHYSHHAWFGAIDQSIFVSVPHLGAPLALFRVLGRDDFEPIVFDRIACKQLASRPDLYPAGHQLLPSSGLQTVTLASGAHASVAAGFPGLGPVAIGAIDRLHAVLDRFVRPPSITYQLAYGRGLNTVSSIRAAAVDDPAPVEVMDSGDTTVPIWSACPSIEVKAARGCFADEAPFDNADHVGILHDPGFLNRLTIWITGTSVAMA